MSKEKRQETDSGLFSFFFGDISGVWILVFIQVRGLPVLPESFGDEIYIHSSICGVCKVFERRISVEAVKY